MKKLIWIPVVLLGLGGTGLVLGSEGERERLMEGARRALAPASDPAYLQECGSCHLAYPPGLLPARSWAAVMDGLADHFGENAELAPERASAIASYLRANAAGPDSPGRAGSVARSVNAGDAPLRITETRYFQRKHHELPRTAVQDNPQVRSFSRCDACHAGAARGSYNEHEVRIPGIGRWDD
jgi:hypothetical protein